MRVILAGVLILIAAAVLSGCNTTQGTGQGLTAQDTEELERAPVTYLPPVQPRHAGSLWTEERHLRLYEDLRARNVGDIVTVRIVENATADSKADTTSDRKQSLGVGVDALFGYMWTHPAAANAEFARFDPGTMLRTSLDNKFQGQGSTSREDAVTASIACRVLQSLPTGNLLIMGTRLVQINFERQVITLEGIVRPADISPDNVVLSTRVADAKITYSGTGPVSDKQKPGWFTQLLDVVWPF